MKTTFNIDKFVATVDEWPTINRIHNPSVDEFNHATEFGKKPILISGVVDQWEASKKWTLTHLSDALGDAEIVVSNQRTNTYFQTQLSNFVDSIIHDKFNDPHYTNFSHHLKSKLIDDYMRPAYFNCWYQSLPENERKIIFSWLYLGTKYSYSKLHIDIHSTSAWNAIFEGKKLWLFYPPTSSAFLYDGAASLFEPDFDRFPNLRKGKPWVCIQGKNEIVFTPSKWWHCVLNLEKGFSLTENFINQTNFKDVYDDFTSIGARSALQKLMNLKEVHTINAK